MNTKCLLALALCAAPLACGSAEPPIPPPLAATAFIPPPGLPEKPVHEPTAEEKKKAADARQLAADRAEWEAALKAETARWTKELHAEAKKVAGAKYPNIKAALGAALKSKVRKPGNAERDGDRHPAETLEFLGLKPNMTVLEWGPGEGWYTEILAPALAASGKLLVTSGDPNGPAEARGTFYAQRTQQALGVSPELFGKVERVVVDGKTPRLPMEGKLDMVLVFRAMHGMHNNKILGTVLAEIHKALKPNGILAVEQHRAKADANPDEAAKKGYLPEAWLIKQIEAAGFKLAAKSEVNANAKDTKDHEEGVWALPPTFRNKDKDRAKYAAIGESDRMTLRFTKKK